MFSQQQIDAIDMEYFEILAADPHNIVVKSRNTQHSWYLFGCDSPNRPKVWIFHRHHDEDLFHRQTRTQTLPQAIRIIQRHDEFQLNGRIPVEHSIWDGVPLEGY